MPLRIRPDAWTPAGGIELEPRVDLVVRSSANAVVIAGPGAGKTELLAQRACYLLQTGICPPPRRILAISFKRDAARNLGDRVARRCAPELARRFDSLTFDAFAKNLLDRFGRALPEQWRPSEDYAIDFEIKERKARELLDSISTTHTGLRQRVSPPYSRSPFTVTRSRRSCPRCRKPRAARRNGPR